MKLNPLTICTFFVLAGLGNGLAQVQKIDTNASFRGLSAVSDNVVWVSGSNGTVGRTIDGGQSWEVIHVSDAAKLDFRDIEAFNANVAYILSIGKGDASRIYKTTDGGKTWKLQFTNNQPDAFFDGIAFWDERHGIAVSDPVNGRFVIIGTDDGGATWNPIPPSAIPPAVSGEGAFAASGTCIFVNGKANAWVVSGGSVARVYRSTDRGRSWKVSDAPIMSGMASTGIFSIAFRDSKHGIVVGGDYQQPAKTGITAATTSDGGQTWKGVENKLPFRSGAVYLRGRLYAVGTSGADISSDGGANWQKLEDGNYNVVGAAGSRVWAAGPRGRIARLVIEK